MWLLNTNSLELEEKAGLVPPYAILSHTWTDDEVSYQDIVERADVASKTGYAKIAYTCRQAREDGLGYAWVDTCCIDKKSSAELSEAVNSMYRWYQECEVCYVYMADVPGEVKGVSEPSSLTGGDYVTHNELSASMESRNAFCKSRWFTRGWTLQELIAPPAVRFYGRDWNYLGSLDSLVSIVALVTGIDGRLLRRRASLDDFSVAQRMSWAAKRQTTRTEDRAYSLLGIFNINMPLLYGEGSLAFIRLQEEIIRSSSDHSIFAWFDREGLCSDGTLLAPYPNFFENSSNIISTDPYIDSGEFSLTNVGLKIHLLYLHFIPKSEAIPVWPPVYPRIAPSSPRKRANLRTVLNCRAQEDPHHLLALNLVEAGPDSGTSAATVAPSKVRLTWEETRPERLYGPRAFTILRHDTRRSAHALMPNTIPSLRVAPNWGAFRFRAIAWSVWPRERFDERTAVFTPPSAAFEFAAAVTLKCGSRVITLCAAYDRDVYLLNSMVPRLGTDQELVMERELLLQRLRTRSTASSTQPSLYLEDTRLCSVYFFLGMLHRVRASLVLSSDGDELTLEIEESKFGLAMQALSALCVISAFIGLLYLVTVAGLATAGSPWAAIGLVGVLVGFAALGLWSQQCSHPRAGIRLSCEHTDVESSVSMGSSI